MKNASIKLVEYHGWQDCILMENHFLRLIITTQVGPRILSLASVNGENIFHEAPALQGLTLGKDWVNYGGHRLWHSPQVGYRPNQPDNRPVRYEINGNTVLLTQEVEPATGIQKQLEVTIAENSPKVTVTHRLYNRTVWPVELAAWALSVMRAEGLAILPVPQRDTQFLPNFSMSFWPWTKLNDERFCPGEKAMLFRQQPENSAWFKLGLQNTEEWGAYLSGGTLFLKTAKYQEGSTYPDGGASFELFIDEHMLELETLSPLSTVPPEGCLAHTEHWRLYDNVPTPKNEEEVLRDIFPLVIAQA